MKLRLLHQALFGFGLAFSATFSSIAAKADDPIVRSDGRILYMVYLNEESVKKEPGIGEAPARSTRDRLNAKEFRGWHQPATRAIVKRLEGKYRVSAVAMTSHAFSTFSAYLSNEERSLLEGDGDVDRLEAAARMDDLSTWSDYSSNGEIVPWGKIAVGTDDGNSSSVTVYEIDDSITFPHSDLQSVVVLEEANPLYVGHTEHATHVAGILAAQMNNGQGSRGINPGATIVNVKKGSYTLVPDPQHPELTDIEIKTAFDWTLADAERNNLYGVANFSSSDPKYSANGALAPWIRRVSNRVLLVQAAGNFNASACNYAYGPTRDSDGILVVGGIDQDGARPTVYDNSTTQNPTYGILPGSNYGPCVEAWAPSVRVYSTWNEPMGRPYEYLSGTSMAAPHVAGLAARYGNNFTTPVEREFFIRSKLQPTGYNDGGFPSYPIKVPSLSNPSLFTVPVRLQPVSITADSTLAGSYTAYVTDGLYLNQGVWNAGHPAPAWIEFDLGAPKALKAIRMSPEQFPAGPSTHAVYAGLTPAPTTTIGTFSGTTATLEPVSISLNFTARYVRVYTAASSAWVAWREIEIYGN